MMLYYNNYLGNIRVKNISKDKFLYETNLYKKRATKLSHVNFFRAEQAHVRRLTAWKSLKEFAAFVATIWEGCCVRRPTMIEIDML